MVCLPVTTKTAALFVALLVLVLWSILNMLLGWKPGFIFSLFGAVIFSLYIVFDTWLITTQLGYDDVVVACIRLYLDIINLFLFILSLLSSNRRP